MEYLHYNSNNQRCFNTSLLLLDDHEIYVVRCITRTDGKIIIPGNDEQCRQKVSPGLNFWWSHWGPSSYFFSVIKFIIDGTEYEPIFSASKGVRNPSEHLFDPRIFKNEYGAFIHSSDVEHIYSVTFDHDNKLVYLYELGLYVSQLVSGHNIQILDIKPIDEENWFIQYLVWFYEDGIQIVDATINETIQDRGFSNKLIDYHIDTIPYEKFKLIGSGSYDDGKEIYGTNSGVAPALSFSTPVIHLDNGWILGVGHSKIHSDDKEYPYKIGSNIENFRSYVNKYYSDKFGDKYKLHLGTGNSPDCYGYIYLLYFYILSFQPSTEKTNERTISGKMYISDSYLPLCNSNLDYRFSLVFPMGLALKDNNIIVTCGEGDYYSYKLSFDLNNVLGLCKHDAKNLDMRSYQYHILPFDNCKI
jgi:hypothetical protein